MAPCIKTRTKTRTKTTQEFIKDSIRVHGHRYNYSEVCYVNNFNKVRIICPDHGPFEIVPNGHLNGRGCKKCANDNLKKSPKDFDREFKEKFPDLEYSGYTGSSSRIEVICPSHGSFDTLSGRFLKSKGCPNCITQKNTRSTEDFIKEAQIVHNHFYDYSESVYTKARDMIDIICPNHGIFTTRPMIHLKGHRCPQCAYEYDSLKDKKCTLYYLYFPDTCLYKIGITTRSIEERYRAEGIDYIVLYSREYEKGQDAYKREQTLIQENSEYLYNGPRIMKHTGNTEVFNKDIKIK